MRKIICDRCGKEMESIAYPNMMSNVNVSNKALIGFNYRATSYIGACMFHSRTYDLCDDDQLGVFGVVVEPFNLCPECAQRLADWFNNGKKGGKINE